MEKFMKVGLASDHGGFELKETLKKFLAEKQYEIIDYGSKVYDPKDDYPDFSENIAKGIINGEVEKGVLICGSGVGACVAANKFKGVRAAICHDAYSAHQGVEHDDMNILCLGARIVGYELAKDLVTAFLNAKFFNNERFKRRLDKVIQFENDFGKQSGKR
jgi:ribose 5-phosphate isomerase B